MTIDPAIIECPTCHRLVHVLEDTVELAGMLGKRHSEYHRMTMAIFDLIDKPVVRRGVRYVRADDLLEAMRTFT